MHTVLFCFLGSEVLEQGSSEPWQDTMERMTGGREFSADAIKEYFAPLTEWLKKQNSGEKIGW
jgi:peptidyl-dipeptidase A